MESSNPAMQRLLIQTLIWVASVTTLIFWAYKKMRGPMYVPGSVSKQFKQQQQQQQDQGERQGMTPKVDAIDSSAATGGPPDIWTMPNGIQLFYFSGSTTRHDNQPPPPNQTNRKSGAEMTTHSAILCMHGGPAIAPAVPWKLFDAIAKDDAVADEIYLYHARGCGKSTRPFSKFPTPGMWPGMKILEQELGIGAQLADVECIRKDRLKVEKLHLVAHSFGGFLATMYAAEFPSHVASLTLMAPAAVLQLPAKDPSKSGDIFKMIRSKLVVISQRSNVDEEDGGSDDGNTDATSGAPPSVAILDEFDAFMKRYLDFGSLPKETDETLGQRQCDFCRHYYRADFDGNEAKVNAAMDKVDKSMIGGMACFAAFMSMGMEHDYIPECRRRLSKAAFPVTIVHGGQDMIPEHTSRQYMDIFPPTITEASGDRSSCRSPRFHLIPDVGHELFDHPDMVKIVLDTMKTAEVLNA